MLLACSVYQGIPHHNTESLIICVMPFLHGNHCDVYVTNASWVHAANAPAGEIIPQAVCSRHGLAVGAHAAWFVQILMTVFAVIAYPISKVLDYLLGAEHTVWPSYGDKPATDLVDIKHAAFCIHMAWYMLALVYTACTCKQAVQQAVKQAAADRHMYAQGTAQTSHAQTQRVTERQMHRQCLHRCYVCTVNKSWLLNLVCLHKDPVL